MFMRHRISAISLLVIFSTLITTGCASTQGITRSNPSQLSSHCLSNTQNCVEQVEVVFIPGNFEETKMEGLVALPLLAGYAVDGVLKLAKYLINLEAQKYESTFSAKTATNLPDAAPRLIEFATSEWSMKTGGMVVFVRTYKCEKAKDDDNDNVRDILSNLDESVNFTPCDPELSISSAIKGQLNKVLDDDQRVAFIGVFAIKPNAEKKSETDTLNIAMLGYYYAALKAKAVKGGEKGALKTKSIATVEIKGPLADYRYGGDQYQAAGIFPLTIKKCNEWQWFNPFDANSNDAKALSPLYRMPASKEISISVSVRETAKMKKLLERLADKVGALEIDVDEWFSEDE